MSESELSALCTEGAFCHKVFKYFNAGQREKSVTFAPVFLI